jgi:ketosteroid isomerase-like protein
MSGLFSALALPKSAPGRDLPAWIPAFYRAYLSRDADLLDAILHDDVEWRLTGPAEQFDLYGLRRGKPAVIEVITRIMPCYFCMLDFEFEHLLVQGDRVAAYGLIRGRQRETRRSICFRGAHFLQFRDGKLMSFRGVADTFDAVEQVVGHPVDITKAIEHVPLAPEDDVMLLTL